MKMTPARTVALAALALIQVAVAIAIGGIVLVVLVSIHPMLVVIAIVSASGAVSYFNNPRGRRRRATGRVSMRG